MEVPCYLTVGDDGKGVLTGFSPVVKKIFSTERYGIYCKPGDWLLIRGLCKEGMEAALGFVPEPRCPLKIILSMELADDDQDGIPE